MSIAGGEQHEPNGWPRIRPYAFWSVAAWTLAVGVYVWLDVWHEHQILFDLNSTREQRAFLVLAAEHAAHLGPAAIVLWLVGLGIIVLGARRMGAANARAHDAFDRVREAEERYRTLFDRSPDAVFLMTVEGHYLDVNEVAVERYGYAREELLSLSPRQLVAVSFDESVTQRLKRGARETLIFEQRHRRKDGSEFPAEVSAQPFVLQGRPCVLCNVRDATSRVRAEDALRASEARFRGIVESTPLGIHLFRLDGDRLVIEGANAAADRILGIDHRALAGRTIEEAFPPLALSPIPGQYRRIARMGGGWSDEQFDYRDDRIAGTYDIHAFQTEPNRVAAVFMDVTERRRAERERLDMLAAVRASEERLDALFESVPDAVYMKDFGHRYTKCNSAMGRAFGVPAEQIVGKRFQDLFPGEDPDPVEALDDEALSGKTVRGTSLNTIQGEKRVFDVVKAPVRDATGNVVGLCGVTRDITQETRLREERDRIEEQYRHTQKMEAVGVLAGGIAHDFNNLLHVINGNVDMAGRTIDDGHPAREMLRETAQAGERAATLVRQLLAFSRRQILRPEDLDPNVVVGELLKMVRRLIGEHIDLNFLPGGNLGHVHADRSMLEQIVLNLCVNARDAMPEGGMLTIETQDVFVDGDRHEGPDDVCAGRYALLRVTDTGCGMDAGTLAHVFDPFFTTKPVGQGTGLGLSMVYGSVKQHEGHVGIHSEPGKGTTVAIYLPILERPAVHADANAEGAASGGHETILLAEDDAMVRRLAQLLLESAGYRVLSAADGLEALDLYGNHSEEIALLLLDVVMPRAGGRRVLDEVRKTNPDVPVLFSSGYSEDAIHNNFVIEEGLELVPKPYTREVLLRRVRQAIDRQPPMR